MGWCERRRARSDCSWLIGGARRPLLFSSPVLWARSDFVRLDSLWVEKAPVLAREVIGEVVDEEDGLLIHLPERITLDNNPPLRVVFGTEVLDLATTFEGEVLDRTREALQQSVVGGDASTELATSSLRVIGAAKSFKQTIQALFFSTDVLTPNGDGINDQVEIGYLLFDYPLRFHANGKKYRKQEQSE